MTRINKGMFNIALMSLSLLLSGCDQFSKLNDDAMTKFYPNGDADTALVVVYPGFKIDDHGSIGIVTGLSVCPGSDQNGCLIIKPEDQTVDVVVYAANGHSNKNETWSIKRMGKFPHTAMHLERPDNSIVMPWNES